MADTQIAPLGVVTAPADYTIPNAQEMTLAAMFAHFDGSAAPSAYVPTLQVISDSGHTILEVPQDASVASGSSVEASWAPFLKKAAVAATITPNLRCRLDAGAVTTTVVAPWTYRALVPMRNFSDNSGGRFALDPTYSGIACITNTFVSVYLTVLLGFGVANGPSTMGIGLVEFTSNTSPVGAPVISYAYATGTAPAGVAPGTDFPDLGGFRLALVGFCFNAGAGFSYGIQLNANIPGANWTISSSCSMSFFTATDY